MRTVFVVVPSSNPTGPVKGAVALANGLAESHQVTLVALKPGPEPAYRVAPGVRVVRLAEHGSFRNRVRAYAKLLQEAGGRSRVTSLSMCLSADFLNAQCKKYARIISSVRGNLPQNYRMDYGPAGLGAATVHLLMLRRFDAVIAMSRSMADQIRWFLGRRPEVVHNFIDEAELEPYRTAPRPAEAAGGAHRFIFVGSLSIRKKPQLMLAAARELKAQGEDVHVRLLGDGPMRQELEGLIVEQDLQDSVELCGQREHPYSELAESDVFVLPSLSEGVSRAALEALYLGVPCVLRDVDANRELIQNAESGRLFAGDGELARTMIEISRDARRRGERRCLLPEEFRQALGVARYRDIIEG